MSEPSIAITGQRLDRSLLVRLVQQSFGTMVKVVVDIRRGVVAVGGELHADAEALLLEDGSAQQDLWGANYYPGRGVADCIEYTALINIRPAQGNPAMLIGDPAIRQQAGDLIRKLVGEGEPL